jgi:solute carrier family 25 S-adenosylmethionine transporter 26
MSSSACIPIPRNNSDRSRGPLKFLLSRNGVEGSISLARPGSNATSAQVVGGRRRSVDVVPAAVSATAVAPPPAAAAAPAMSSSPPPPSSSSALKPASDVLAGALARAASQSTIHPLDTMKVRLQTASAVSTPSTSSLTTGGAAILKKAPLSKTGQLMGTTTGAAQLGHALSHAKGAIKGAGPVVASLYNGVLSAASGAGIAIGAYFACYGVAHNLLAEHTKLDATGVAFVAGGLAAAGSSIVKVPLAVCIRSVQAGVYGNAVEACTQIVKAAGPRGLFTGYLPTVLEDVPDMAFKFAAYESLRNLHRSFNPHRSASPSEDFAMGLISGAFAAAATTPLDVIKTNMMVNAKSRPDMVKAAASVWKQGGPSAFFRGVGPRATSQGINSAVFFAFFEALSRAFKQNLHLKPVTAE